MTSTDIFQNRFSDAFDLGPIHVAIHLNLFLSFISRTVYTLYCVV